jgi:hypothetical protein
MVILWQVAEEEWRQIACHTAGRNLALEEWQRYFRDIPYHATCSGSAP